MDGDAHGSQLFGIRGQVDALVHMDSRWLWCVRYKQDRTEPQAPLHIDILIAKIRAEIHTVSGRNLV